MFKAREQELLRCTIMRGGTSKAIFFKKNELPADPTLRDSVILAAFGSPDVRQIDGLGGSDITTSKIAIIGPPTHPDADVDYDFGQVQLKTPTVVWNSNCGNISSAVGPYAIDEGMVSVTEPYTTVRIHNVNTRKVLIAKVRVKDGKAAVCGDFVLDGVPGTGAKIELDYRLTFGSATGKLLPTGNPVDILDIPGLGKIPVSIVDIANAVVFVDAESIGLTGKEAPPFLRANPEITAKLEKIRSYAAYAAGIVNDPENATVESPVVPQMSFVAPAMNYEDYATGNPIHKDEVDFLARVLFNQLPTDTFTGTGTICATVASQIKGTLVNLASSRQESGLVRLGHARGVNLVDVDVDNTPDGPVVKKAVFNRTARRIMDGYVYIKPDRL